METKTPNFHPPPLLMAAMHPPPAPPAARPALRVFSPPRLPENWRRHRQKIGDDNATAKDWKGFSFDVNIVLQRNFRNLEDGEEKREREKEKKTATTQPIFLGSILTLHSMSPNPCVKTQFILPEFLTFLKIQYASQAALWGIEGLPDLGEIYPLGGSADRLGLVDPHTGECLPAAMLRHCGQTLFEGLIRDLQAREFMYFTLYGKHCATPVAIMTSSAKNNHERITSLCERLRWFGRASCSSCWCRRWSMAGHQTMHAVCKPGGHGVIWKLAYDKGIFQCFYNHGRKGATVRQVRFDPLGIGRDWSAPWKGSLSLWSLITPLSGEFPANSNILYVDLPSAELIASRKSETSLPGMVFNTKKPITYVDQFGTQHRYVPRTFDVYHDKLSSNQLLLFTRVPGGRLECTMQNITDNFFNAHSSRCCEGVEEGESEPAKMFDRMANLANNQIINRRCDPTKKWEHILPVVPRLREVVECSCTSWANTTFVAVLWTKGKLNAFESLELSQLVVNQNKKNLLENWVAEDKLECSEELGDVVKVAKEYSEQLGVDACIKLLEQFKSYDGPDFFLGSCLSSTEDPEFHFKYIEVAAKIGQIKEAERGTRESNFYDAEKTELLDGSKASQHIQI
ncbi:hypothetical protein RHMOL_Rhmol12G0079900 [Rhododendron molle]|uniref:Uncharacterized protein n=1 Tax=Rhododendron molle TaxID=49168 RepID=A0ACC0LGH5_RHOML|nr:hypothetical protein RHMOL_Rhmol12G0079900 [Rhododendron molle]